MRRISRLSEELLVLQEEFCSMELVSWMLVGWLVFWLVGRLVGWLIGWLVGWFVC